MKGDPYVTMARWASTCPICQTAIDPGDRIIVWPKSGKGRKACHYDCSEASYLETKALIADEETFWGGVGQSDYRRGM